MIGDKALLSLRLSDLEGVLNRIIERGHLTTARQTRNVLKEIFKASRIYYRRDIELGRITWIDIAEDLNPVPKPRKKDKALWEEEELKAFIEQAKTAYYEQGGVYYPMIRLMLSTGLRVGEARGLRKTNVHPTYIEVVEQIPSHSKTGEHVRPKTVAGDRRIPISKGLYKLLQEHWKRMPESELCFPSRTGTVISYHNFSRSLELFCDRANVPRITTHDLRKDWFTRLTEKLHKEGNYNIKLAMELIGHNNSAVAHEVYTRVSEKSKDIAVIDIEDEEVR